MHTSFNNVILNTNCLMKKCFKSLCLKKLQEVGLVKINFTYEIQNTLTNQYSFTFHFSRLTETLSLPIPIPHTNFR